MKACKRQPLQLWKPPINPVETDNPLNNEVDKAKTAELFGNLSEKLCTKKVFKYTHAGLLDGIGDQRPKLNEKNK